MRLLVAVTFGTSLIFSIIITNRVYSLGFRPSFLVSSASLLKRISLISPLLMMGTSASRSGEYPIYGDESIMSKKEHGTCTHSVQEKLRWNCDFTTADRICCFNRHYAEYSGYWESTTFLKEADRSGEITFFDSVTGKPLFVAPRGRSFDDFVAESRSHGWPSFRDNEVVWENVRCLSNGEAVSVDGTHLGHNLPDRKGNRYCINLVSVAGSPSSVETS